MAQLIVRNLETRIVAALKARAAARGHSMEAEHRDILRAALGRPPGGATFKAVLVAMPDVGSDADFARARRRPRSVRL
jgi:plasmid stability protein